MISVFRGVEPTAVEVSIETVPWLPACSWVSEVAQDHLSVQCGVQVETGIHGAFEGVWDGIFASFDFDRADIVFGSGCRLRDDRITFVAPSHTLEALYVHESPDRMTVSNSLVHLLRHKGIEVPDGVSLCQRLATTVLGMDGYERTLFETAEGHVTRVVNATLVVTAMGARAMARSGTRRFADFAAYRGYLHDIIARLALNGQADARGRRLALLSTVSSGYDSAACAALVRSHGGREAVTLATGRSGRSDSGRAVAESLGLQAHGFDRFMPEDHASMATLQEFAASGFGGEDVALASFAPLLPGRILCTGFHGDKLWERSAVANDRLERGDLSGSSLTEFRLRVGFAHAPLPFIGAFCHADISRITRSTEMASFSVGGAYDRPIPRRLAEEAGVPRGLFGQRKEAVSLLAFAGFAALPRPARAAFRALGFERASWARTCAQAWWAVRMTAWRVMGKLMRTTGLRAERKVAKVLLGIDPRVFEHSAPISSELFFRWGLRGIAPRYEQPPQLDVDRARAPAD